MRRFVGLMAMAALLPATAPPPPLDARRDAREVLEAVVRSTTARYGRGWYAGRMCVQSRITRPSMAGGGRRDHGRDLLFSWRAPEDGRDRSPHRDLPAGDREALREALRTATFASTQRRWLSQVEPAWVAAALGLCAGVEHRRLAFGSPVIVGDVAFVSVDIVCPQCGEGNTVALRRTARGWVIVAWRNDFMS